MGISWQEIVVVLLIVLVLFGPKRLPEVGKSLGHGIREFKDSMTGATRTEQPQVEKVSAMTTAPATADNGAHSSVTQD